MAGKRVLVIEDDPANLRLILVLLKAAGYSALGVASGEEGLVLARQERPDLILCDGYLPQVDGFEVLRRIRSDAGLATLPVVAISGIAGREDGIARIEAAGFDGFIAKPFDLKTFGAEVSRFLEEPR